MVKEEKTKPIRVPLRDHKKIKTMAPTLELSMQDLTCLLLEIGFKHLKEELIHGSKSKGSNSKEPEDKTHDSNSF